MKMAIIGVTRNVGNRMLRAQLIGSTVKVFGKLLDREQIGSRGSRGIVAALEFLEHPVSQLSHKKYLL
jgi:hypothetical protein